MTKNEQLSLGDWAKRLKLEKQQESARASAPAPETLQRYPAERPSSAPRQTSYRSNLAFKRTLEAYLAEAEQAAKKRTSGKFVIRMWTVTAVEALPYTLFMRRWNDFVRFAKRQFPGFSCIRVVEVHPGEDYEIPGQPGRWDTISHGLHMHFVADKYYPQGQMQHLATRANLGHVSVSGKMGDGKRHTVASVTNYLSKYLRKGLHENSAGLRGRQLWAAVNYSGSVGVRDIVTISRWSVVFHRLSTDMDFCFYGFKMRAKIAYEGEILSRLVEGLSGGLPAVLAIQSSGALRDWTWPVEKLWRLLRPSVHAHSRYHEDRKQYSYLPASLGGTWPGVTNYLEWLQSPEGREWALAQNTLRIEADRQRQRERRRELAQEKKRKLAETKP